MRGTSEQALKGLAKERSEEAFSPKHPLLTQAQAQVEASRCLYCVDAPCIQACPTSIDIPGFIRRITTGNVKGAAVKILSQNILGLSCATACPTEVLCEGACVYNHEDTPPIRIGELQHFSVAETLNKSGFPLTPKPLGNKKVAIVGGGPGGIAAAAELRLLGIGSTVFESRSYPGGLSTYGVAPYKLSATQALDEARVLETALQLDIRTGVHVGRDIKGATLLNDYDAVVIACGIGDDGKLDVPGKQLQGVQGATEWIEQMKLSHLDLSQVDTALIVGAGNTALDCAQELCALQVKNVFMVYRRSEKDMPGYAHEWAHAKALGARIIEHTNVASIHGETHVESVTLAKTDKTTSTLPCQRVLWAVGQDKRFDVTSEFPGVTTHSGHIAVDAHMMTTAKGVFACGDAINGGKEVVNAAAEAKQAALAIERYLRSL